MTFAVPEGTPACVHCGGLVVAGKTHLRLLFCLACKRQHEAPAPETPKSLASTRRAGQLDLFAVRGSTPENPR